MPRCREDHALAQWARTHRLVITDPGIPAGPLVDLYLEIIRGMGADVLVSCRPDVLQVRILSDEL